MFDAIRDPRTWLIVATVALVLVVPATGEWSQWRADASHAGEANPSVPIHAPGLAWDHEADHHPVASPAVADVDGGPLTITATYPASEGEAGSVIALEPDGSVAWEQTPSPLTTGGFVASPAILEDGGETAIIAAKAEDSTVYRLDAETGDIEASWQMGTANRDVLVSPPTIADVDDDGEPEILVGGSTSEHDGAIYVLSPDLDEVLFEHELNAPVWSSPLLDDVDGDGDDELVVSTGVPDAGCIVFGTLHPTNNPRTGDDEGRLYVFDRAAPGWDLSWDEPLEGPTMSSPTTGDIDADGSTEVVVGSQGPRGGCTDVTQVQMDGYLQVFGDDGTLLDSQDGSLVLSVTTPLVHDLHDDGVPEVVHGTWNGLNVYDGAGGSLSTSASYDIVGDDRHDQDHWVLASPAVVDLDDDGSSDLVAQTIPVDINEQSPLESDVKPGAVFAVSPDAGYGAIGVQQGPLTIDANGLQPRWVYPTPEDGGLSGPIAADATGDGWGEVLVGTGFPVIGDSTTTRAIGADNPVVGTIDTDPATPKTVDEVTFEADVRDQDSPESSLEHAWELGDGSTATEAQPVHSYADDGTYTIALTVSDPDGHTWTQQRVLEVANTAPDVDAAIQTTPGSLEVSFEGQATDPDGTVEGVNWTLGDGNTSQATSLTHTYETGGSYEATFEAVDDDQDASTVEKTLHVNRFPTLSGPTTATASEGQQATVAFPYDDLDGDEVHVEAITGAPGAEAQVLDDEIQLAWTPDHDIAMRDETPVTVDVDLAIEDEGRPAGIANHTVQIDVEDTNRAPEITAPSEAKASSGQTTVIEGFATDPDGDPVGFEADGLPASATFTNDSVGWEITVDPPSSAPNSTHDVTITADDGLDQGHHTLTLDIVPNQPPEVAIEGPGEIEASTAWDPNPITFEGTAEDPEGDAIRRWSWNLSGVMRHGQEVTHAFDEHGTYDIELTAMDSQLAAGETTRTIEIDDALTGDVFIHRADKGLTMERIVTLHVHYDDGTPLAGANVDLKLVHEDLQETTAERQIVTDADGTAKANLEGEMGLPFFVPGEHTVRLETQAPSLPSAPVQDTETLTMQRSFQVSPAP